MPADNLFMKEINKHILRKQLQRTRAASKPELAKLTGLSVVTVNSLISEMIREKEVSEGELQPSGGGRPSMQYCYNPDFCHAVVVYSESNTGNVHMRVINLFGEIVEQREEHRDRVMVDSFDSLLDEAFDSYPGIRLIAFGLPGMEENGVIIINDYPDIIGTEFMKHYQERYQIPVYFENDVNAAVSGYYHFLQEEGIRCTAGIYFPNTYAVGAGLIIDGEVHKGLHHFAGEIKYIPLFDKWEETGYQDEEKAVRVIATLAIIYICTVAPDRLVLYGDFWTEKLKEAIVQYVRNRLNAEFSLTITFSDNMYEDYEKGMIRLAMMQMEKQLAPERENI